MRRLRLIKIAVPEIVAYFGQEVETMEPKYRCPCGMGVAEEYKCCPYCTAELAWDKVIHFPLTDFRKLINRL